MALKLNSSGGGSVTIDPVSTASNVTITIPATNAGSVVTADSSGNVTATGDIAAVGGTFSGDVQSASQNGGQLAGLRNKIINGNMGIAQRGTAAVTTNFVYGPADRWRNEVSGNTISTTRGAFVSGDILYDTGSAQYFTQIAVTSVAAATSYSVLSQPIEDVRLLAGQTVTVSFWAKAASGTPLIGLSLDQYFGLGGSPSASVEGTGQAQAITTTWTQYSKTFTVPSINGKTIGTTANTSSTALYFWLDAGANFNTRSGSIGQASKTVSIAQVQLEIGSVATPFEHRPIGIELALCQRYYQTGSFVNNVGALNNTTYYASIPFKVTMRITPGTVTFTTPGVYAAATALVVSTIIADNSTAEALGVGINPTTQPQGACRILGGSYTASSEL